MPRPELVLLDRAETILRNMATENDDRCWWEFWKPRWAISDEPLRNDAKNFLVALTEYRQTGKTSPS